MLHNSEIFFSIYVNFLWKALNYVYLSSMLYVAKIWSFLTFRSTEVIRFREAIITYKILSYLSDF